MLDVVIGDTIMLDAGSIIGIMLEVGMGDIFILDVGLEVIDGAV